MPHKRKYYARADPRTEGDDARCSECDYKQLRFEVDREGKLHEECPRCGVRRLVIGHRRVKDVGDLEF